MCLTEVIDEQIKFQQTRGGLESGCRFLVGKLLVLFSLFCYPSFLAARTFKRRNFKCIDEVRFSDRGCLPLKILGVKAASVERRP